jgi:hypothetical protein
MSKVASRAAAAALLSFALIAGAACTKTQEYAATGGLIGAGGGALIAGATGGSVAGGAVVGGAAGAVTGAIIAQN